MRTDHPTTAGLGEERRRLIRKARVHAFTGYSLI